MKIHRFYIGNIGAENGKIVLNDNELLPELRDRGIYFFVKLSKKNKSRLALIEIPDSVSRFVVLPQTNDLKFIILVDDIIRYCLEEIFFIFDHDNIEAYSIQLTRDAELDRHQQNDDQS